jgi:hypothetical protein
MSAHTLRADHGWTVSEHVFYDDGWRRRVESPLRGSASLPKRGRPPDAPTVSEASAAETSVRLPPGDIHDAVRVF